MIWLYRLFYVFFKRMLLILKPFMSLKTQTWIQLRHSNDFKKFTCTQALWFHASSGEIEYCKSVIKEIKDLKPQQKIILSYSSPSAEKLFFNIKNSVDLIFPLPWDSPNILRQAIRHLKPKALIFSRTDFWPELIMQAQKQRVPLIAISMYPRLNCITQNTYKWLLKKFVFISTVDDSKSKCLEQLLHQNIFTFSDTRFDQVFHRLENPSRVTFDFSHNQRGIIFASTWPEDEKYILPLLPQLIKQNFQVILAPHDISRAMGLASDLKELSPTLFSSYPQLIKMKPLSSLLIVDQIGYLADIYRSTDLAFIGGSFKKRIHSVMEPLGALNSVFFGPFFHNNPEAIETHDLGLAKVVNSTQDMLQFIESMTPMQLAENKKHIQQYTEKQRGASRLIAEKILHHSQDNL